MPGSLNFCANLLLSAINQYKPGRYRTHDHILLCIIIRNPLLANQLQQAPTSLETLKATTY